MLYIFLTFFRYCWRKCDGCTSFIPVI